MPGGTYPSRWSFLRFFAIDKLVTLSDDREVAKFSQNSYHCTFRNQSFKIKIINSRAARPTLKKWRNRSGHKSDTAAIISITFCNQYQPLSKAYLRPVLPQSDASLNTCTLTIITPSKGAMGSWLGDHEFEFDGNLYSTRIGNIFTTYTSNRLNGLTKFGKN